MPCSDGPWPDRELSELRQRNDKLAQMLCGVCNALEKDIGKGGRWFIDIVPGLGKWWDEHKKQDAARIEREKYEEQQCNLKKSALQKLSLEERKALGLK